MRPGKPLMFGRLGSARVLGLPGNPAAAFVCSRLFLVPLVWRLLGRPTEGCARLAEAIAGVALEPNGPRQHYMRAVSHLGADGRREVIPAPSQSSALIAPLARADCLIVRPPHAPAAAAGSVVPVLPARRVTAVWLHASGARPPCRTPAARWAAEHACGTSYEQL